MIGRIEQFLPSILILVGIAAGTFLYLQLVMRRWRENIKSIEWCKENKWKMSLFIGIPATNVWAPAAEELVFRAPLIVAFSSLSGNAWIGIMISSAIFASVHYFGQQITFLDVLSAKENGKTKTDDFQAETAEIEKAQAKQMKIRRLFHVVATFPLGMLTGYCGIKYQSIWVSVGIHSVWNFLMPVIVALFIFLTMIAYFSVTDAWNKLKWRYRSRKYHYRRFDW